MPAHLLHGLVPSATPRSNSAPEHDLIYCARFLALVSPAPPNLDNLPPTALADLALTHNALLVAYCTRSTVLPMRFGAAFSSTENLRRHLDQSAPRHVAALQTLARLDEYILRLQIIGDPPAPTLPVGSGRDFLARGRSLRDQRLSLTERRRALARTALADLEPISHQTEAAGTPRSERLLDIAILLNKTRRDLLATLAARVAEQAPALGLELIVTGPWPAYSFHAHALEEVCNGA